jgi:predicted glycosyltransferase
LEAAILYAKTQLEDVRLILVLRDILDAPSATRGVWRREGYGEAIERYFDRVLVLGTPSLFDVRTEYSLSAAVRSRVRFCGYLRRTEPIRDRAETRQRLGVAPDAQLVLVTPGGGEDGERLVQTYVEALPDLHARPDIASVIVTGPEMGAAGRLAIASGVGAVDRAIVLEFSDDMLSVMAAADAIVCMGGYNTLCEVASLGKRAVVVPRSKPVMEQWIRAERFSRAGLVSMLDPARLDATSLSRSVIDQLTADPKPSSHHLPLTALPRVARQVEAVLRHRQKTASAVTVSSPRLGAA